MFINYQDKIFRLSTSLADVIMYIHHASKVQIEITNKIKVIREIDIKKRACENDEKEKITC